MKQIYILTTLLFLSFSLNTLVAQDIWIGDDITFTKAGGSDWTLEENQDRLTDNVWFTRQNNKSIYNYKWWQNNFNADATNIDIYYNFWNDEYEGSPSQEYTPSGGTQGVRWALLDDTGSTSDWSGYNFGILGEPDNFHSFNNIMEIMKILEGYPGDFSTIEVVDDFTVTFNGVIFSVPDVGDYILGKKFGLWLMEDDVYLTLTFTEWGNGQSGAGFTYTRSTDALLSSKDFAQEGSYEIYPNPSSDFISIKGLNKQSSYSIHNVIGSTLASGFASDETRINIQDLEAGVYFIRFENGETKRFIRD